MKKFIAFMFVAIATLMSISSCKEDKVGFTYNLTTTANTDGNVGVTFPVGSFTLDGTADLNLLVANDSTYVPTNEVVYSLSQCCADCTTECSDSTYTCERVQIPSEVVASAARVNSWLDGAFDVTSAEGHYDVKVTGYVKENLTGFTFSIDKEWSNK